MDGIGNEVTQQIRNAIKGKLTELGAYVDDELPDYIMVMVANKKTKAQMIEDLSLFLGNSTEIFTTWLHNVLDRLQFVTVVKPQIGDTSDEPTKNIITSSTQNMTGETIKEINPVINPIIAPIISTREVPVQKATKPEKLVRKEKKMKLTELDENEDFLALKDEPDTDDPLVEELKEDSTLIKITKSITNISSGKPILKRQNIVAPIQKSSLSNKEGAKEISKPISIKRRLDLTSIKPKIQRPFSAVGAIVKREERFIEEEEYDPHNPSVASVVCISERRPSVPPALQANKLLLLKAVEDAHKSVVSREKKTPARVEPYKPTPIRQLFARNRKQVITAPLTNMEQLADEENLSDIDLDENDAQEQDTRTVVSCKDKHQLKNTKLDNNDDADADIEKENESQIYIKASELSTVDSGKTKLSRKRKLEEIDISENVESTPHFVVTLDGVDPSNFLKKKQRRNVVTNKMPLSPTNNKFELDELELTSKDSIQADEAEEIVEEEEIMDESVEEKIQERCRYWPACKRGDICEYHHPRIPCKTFPNCKFADKCLYIHPNCKFDALCTRRDCPFTHASKRAFSPGSIPYCVVIKNKIPPAKKNCRFFPNCFNSKCPYIHPKICRYGANCQTPNCSFNHSIIPSPAQLKWTAPKISQPTNSQ